MPFYRGFPLAFIVALTGLEILIAFLQAYVFLQYLRVYILTMLIIYINLKIGGLMEIEAAKVIGADLAVIGVIGSGVGIGNISLLLFRQLEEILRQGVSLYNDNVRFRTS